MAFLTMDRLVCASLGCTAASFAGAQAALLAESVALARSRSRMYAQKLAGLPAPVTPGNLVELPFTQAGEFASSPQDTLTVPARDASRLITVRSSGTSSDPKSLYFTRADMDSTADFFLAGMAHMCAAMRVTVFMGDSRPDTVASLLERALPLAGALVRVSGPVTDEEKALRDAKGAQCLVGMPVPMLRLSRLEPRLKPVSVLLSADYAPEALKRSIERTWGCRVFTHYGMSETGYGLAVQCAAGDCMHLRANAFYAEAVDPQSGEGAAFGQEGEIVITSLAGAMRLVRYRTGDCGTLGQCACGSPLPAIRTVSGRLENGRRCLLHRLDDLLFQDPGVDDYRARAGEGELTLTVQGMPKDPDLRLKASLAAEMPVRIVSGVRLPPHAGKRAISPLEAAIN